MVLQISGEQFIIPIHFAIHQLLLLLYLNYKCHSTVINNIISYFFKYLMVADFFLQVKDLGSWMHSTIPTFSMTGFLLPEQRGNLTPKCFLEMFVFLRCWNSGALASERSAVMTFWGQVGWWHRTFRIRELSSQDNLVFCDFAVFI